MKIRSYFLIIVFCICLFLNSCQPGTPISPSDEKDYIVADCVLSTGNPNIEFHYPQLDGKEIEIDSINRKITEFCEEKIKVLWGDNTGVTAQIGFTVSYADNEKISVLFTGVSNTASAAHPINLFFTFNMDLKTQELLRLKDLYTVTMQSVQQFRDAWKQQTPSEASSYLAQYTDEQLLIMLQNSDSEYGDVFSGFSPNQIFIYFPVPHAIGDYLKIVLSVSSL